MVAQTALPEPVDRLPHARLSAATMARPDTSSMRGSDDSFRMAGAVLPSSTAIVAACALLSSRTVGALSVWASTFSMKTVPTTLAAAISSGCDHNVNQCAISLRERLRLAVERGNSARARRDTAGVGDI